jgi:hypothetical protein
MKSVVPLQQIEKTIFMIRGQKVMLSTHLAGLYDVEPKVLMQAVKRNIARFPEDFMFQLSVSEFDNLKSQIVTSSWGGMRRTRPYAFTEQRSASNSFIQLTCHELAFSEYGTGEPCQSRNFMTCLQEEALV